MKNKRKSIKRSLLLIATILMVITVSACGSSSGADTYTQELDFAEFANNSMSSGFLSAIGAPDTSKQMNTLILNEDNTYSLTKNITITQGTDDSGDIIIEYIFTGNYTKEGTMVTLDAAENVEYSEEWGSLVESGHKENISGSDEVRLAYFPSQFLVESSGGNAEATVEVNSKNNTLKYIEVNE